MPPSTMPAQVFVRGLDGRSRCVDLPGDASRGVSIGHLSRALARAPWGAPEAELLVACGARVYAPAREPDACLPAGSACTLLLRVAGGKGGFGSLLRGAGTSGAATTNQDACRDLSGRRIRHVEAERKLREHARTQPQRDLERIALAHIKTKENGVKRRFAEIETEEKQKYARDSGAVADGVAASVRAGIERAKSADDAKGKAPAALGARRASDRAPRGAYIGDPLARGGVSDDSDDSGSDADEAPAAARRRRETAPAQRLEEKGREGTGAANVANAAALRDDAVGGSGGGGPIPDPSAASCSVDAAASTVPAAPERESPLDLSTFTDAAALEAVGLDGLKRELQARGLKCGGTLAQRAERLFLLRVSSVEALDAKHKAPARRA